MIRPSEQKTDTQKTFVYRKVFRVFIGSITILLLVVVGGCVYVSNDLIDRLAFTEHKVGVTQTATLVGNAIKARQVDAPIDPKTGDAYFPVARLYLPAKSGEQSALTYTYDDLSGELSISSAYLINAKIASLLTAENGDVLFKRIPGAQACSRGVRVLETEKAADQALVHKAGVHLDNGKTVHLYFEDACPELAGVVTALKQLKSY